MIKNKSVPKKIHIKKGDKVRIIAGKHRNEEGVILEIFPKQYRAIVEGWNMVKKHTKPSNDNPGGISEMASPIHISNLMLIDPKSGKPTRIGRKIVDGKSTRYSKNSGEIIK